MASILWPVLNHSIQIRNAVFIWLIVLWQMILLVLIPVVWMPFTTLRRWKGYSGPTTQNSWPASNASLLEQQNSDEHVASGTLCLAQNSQPQDAGKKRPPEIPHNWLWEVLLTATVESLWAMTLIVIKWNWCKERQAGWPDILPVPLMGLPQSVGLPRSNGLSRVCASPGNTAGHCSEMQWQLTVSVLQLVPFKFCLLQAKTGVLEIAPLTGLKRVYSVPTSAGLKRVYTVPTLAGLKRVYAVPTLIGLKEDVLCGLC